MTEEKVGPTGKFPDGSFGPHDEGEITIGVTHDEQGNVYIDFGKQVIWMAMPKERAVGLAKLLLYHAGVLRRGSDDVYR
jgi:hypothetical protein